MSSFASPTPSPQPEPPAPPRPPALATWGFGLLCVAGYVASYAFGRGSLDPLTLTLCGAKDRELIVAQGEWWRLISCGFLHANFIHLGVNLYALSILGPLVERLWGTRRLILIYVVALIAGSATSTAATAGISIGASGAVFGLFGAIAVFSTVHRRLIAPGSRGRLWLNLLLVAAVNVALGISIRFIDNAAHAGGFAGGVLAALLLRPVPFQDPRRTIRDKAVRIASALAVAAVGLSLAQAVRYAASADWILLARTEMERRTLSGGEGHSLFVPKGWTYEPPKQRGGFHRFVRPGRAAVLVRILAPGHWSNLDAVARDIEAAWAKEGAPLLYRREIAVGDRVATDLAFRFQHGGVAERDREVIFATSADQLVHVGFQCAERDYRLLEILFDEILLSIDRTSGNPRDPEAFLRLAIHYRNERRDDAAEQSLRVALGLKPDYADAHDQLALLYATASGRLHRPEAAIHHAELALRIKPDKPMYLATLAAAYEAAGRQADALATARKAAALAPDDAAFADLVKRLERR